MAEQQYKIILHWPWWARPSMWLVARLLVALAAVRLISLPRAISTGDRFADWLGRHVVSSMERAHRGH